MASWTWLRHAPWGEIVKAAARVPEFVRDLRKGGDDDEAPTPPRPTAAAEAPSDISQLKFELELLKSNIDKLRGHSEAQGRAMEEQARALAESFNAISARLRTVTWLAAAALAAPFLLMYPLLADANCRAFAGLAALSAAAVALVAPASRVAPVSLRDGAGAFAAGFALLTAACLVFLGLQDADPRVFVAEALAYAQSQAAFYHFFRD